MKITLSTTTRRLVGAVILLLIAAYLVFSSSDESRARENLNRVAGLLSKPVDGRGAKLRAELDELCALDLSVDVPDVVVENGRARVVDATLARLHGTTPVISLEKVELRRTSSERFDASFDARISDSQAGDLHADIRSVRAVMVKSPTGWQLSALRSTARASVEPEARP